MHTSILQQKTGFSSSGDAALDWRDHTALGYWAVADQIDWLVEVSQELNPEYDPWLMGFGDPPYDAGDRILMAQALHACAGLESYPKVVAEYCELLGYQAGEWLRAGGPPPYRITEGYWARPNDVAEGRL